MKCLIAVDGLDGCGKDTHALRIKKLLEDKGEAVTVISHPSKRALGKLSKRSLEESGGMARLLATLFFTADVLRSVSWYKRQKEGTVIFVRYLLGTAYLPSSIAPRGYAFFRNLLPFPDLALFIDIDPEVALRRIEQRDHKREMFETKEKLEAVREVAKGLTKRDWCVIDNSTDGEMPFEKVEALLRSRGII
jgi:dTMP kinase